MTDRKQQKNVGYFNCLCNRITDEARCALEIKSRITMAKAAFNKMQTLFTNKMDLNLKKKLVKCYVV
jgi:hypothetical protein